MKNYIQPGESITVTAPAAVKSGEGVLVGDLFGLATGDAASGADVTIVRRGVFAVNKKTGAAWTEGQKVYWETAGSQFVAAASGNKLVGTAVEAAASDATTGTVLLDGATR